MVCWAVMIVSLAKMAETIEMSIGIWTWESSRNYVLDRVQISLCKGAILTGKRGAHCKDKYTDCLPGVVQKRLNQTRCHLGHELRWVQGRMYYIGCILAPLANTNEP